MAVRLDLNAPILPLWPAEAKLATWFAPSAIPLEIDFGCHRGAFLLGMSAMYLERRFLGIERQPLRVQRCLDRILRNQRHNAHAVEGTGTTALEQWLPDASVTVLHVSFPDPWPKRKHAPRRLVNPDFLDQCRRVLAPDGTLRLMTDDAAYFEEMLSLTTPAWQQVPWGDPANQPPTAFERRFLALNQIPHRVALRKSPPNTSSTYE